MAASPLHSCYAGKTVWLSGHTGFKGGWLASWLLEMGARVRGFSLDPPTSPCLFSQIGLAGRLDHEYGDVRDQAAVRRSIEAAQPDFVFHLAAQAIVRTSFTSPAETWAANVMGTIHVMEALRTLDKPCAAVMVTSDKCYENREWLHGYREEDPLGGFDPYSSSKGAAEVAIASWRRSFFENHPVRLASARAGNVIGGGDWAADRIVPDCVRALQEGRPIAVRNRISTRPWQHVLDPLSGYLWLGAVLAQPGLRPFDAGLYSSAFNFGPSLDSNRTVEALVAELLLHWPGAWEDRSDPAAVHEAKLLNLSTDKACHLLGWKPNWTFEQAVAAAAEWYRDPDPAAATARQIARYEHDASRQGRVWAARKSASAVG
jgi:CDP-glucose 4,6-dehydratase